MCSLSPKQNICKWLIETQTETVLLLPPLTFYLIKTSATLNRIHPGSSLFALPGLEVFVCCSQRFLHVLELSQSAGFLQRHPAVVLVLVGQSHRRRWVPELGQSVHHLFGFATYLVMQLVQKAVHHPQLIRREPCFLLGFSQSRGEVIFTWIHVTWWQTGGTQS